MDFATPSRTALESCALPRSGMTPRAANTKINFFNMRFLPFHGPPFAWQFAYSLPEEVPAFPRVCARPGDRDTGAGHYDRLRKLGRQGISQHDRAAADHESETQTTPSSRNVATSPALMPSHSPKTSPVCSPRSGDGSTGGGAPSKRTGKL